MNYPGISIIIAVLNEEKHIAKCLDSLIKQNYQGKFEIIIADGGSRDNTVSIINEYKEKYENIVLLNNPKINQAAGRNLCINESQYSLIAYLDGHSYADKNWLKTLYDSYDSKKTKNLAGISSVYKNAINNNFTKSTEVVLKSVLAGANKNHFLNSESLSETNNGYAFLYNKEILFKIGLYDENLITAEDIELNQRLISNGYELYVQPNAVTYYHRKNNLKDFIKQQYRYGIWRSKVIFKHKLSYKPFVPMLFVIFVLLGFIISLFIKPFYELYKYPILVYLVFIFYHSSKLGILNKLSSFRIFVIALSLHFSYGIGMIAGFFKKIK